MSRLIFAEYPELDESRGLVLVQTEDMPSYLSSAHTDALNQAMTATGFHSPEASFLAAMHRNGVIPRALMHVANDTLDALDPADDLLSQILLQEDTGLLPETGTYENASAAASAHQTDDNFEFMIIAPNGLDVLDYNQDNEPNYSGEEIDRISLGENAYALASELNLTHFGFQHRLVWKRQANGEWKSTIYDGGSCTSLGALGINGTFEPVVTVLGHGFKFGTQI